VPRSIAQISYNGTVQTEAFAVTSSSSGVNSGIFDGVYSPDGNQFYTSGFSGVYYYSSITTSANLQSFTSQILSTSFTVTAVESFGGTLYGVGAGSSSGTNAQVFQIGTAGTLPTTANQPTTNLISPNTTTQADPIFFPVDMFLTHTNGTGAPAGLNTLYITDDGKNFGQGAVTKWSLVNGTWIENGAILYSNTATLLGFYYETGTTNAGVVTLDTVYGNGGNGNFGPGYLYSIVDSGGWNAPFSSSIVTTVAIVASVAGGAPLGGSFVGSETFRGVAFTPQAQTTTLVDNGPNPANGSQAITLTVTVASPGSINVPNGGAVTLEDASNGHAHHRRGRSVRRDA
jgi:hypothetical protein